ncbi:MAG TPA: D-alanyl-D-alanine carboxypeptidase [Pseudolabrys sp.]|nr:D-alanyl-D-alanine carboxypeptidase [Pseudolabrys sp.]
MSRAGVFVQRPFRWSALGLITLLAVAAVCTDADARGRRHRHHAAAESYEPPYSSMVVDANSGAVLQATNADSLRHPASLTKIMTLYLLFERLEAGKIKMSTEMEVSPHAAEQAPSKLDLKPGQSIEVETAIRAIVTKSANDVAVVVAEALGGSEENFARQMTAKARALGMTHTVYRDASGLPNDEQITTARDMTILARAIQDRFPQYYPYFATRTFKYRGEEFRNHNHLLGRVDGVDGMKTGYIRDSGFNIVVSMRRSGRHLIAVVFGGHSASARDARVESLLDDTVQLASVKRTAPPVGEAAEIADARAKKSIERVAAAAPAPKRSEPVIGSTAPIKPNPVKAFSVSATHTASIAPTAAPDGYRLVSVSQGTNPSHVTTVAVVKREAPPLPTAKPGLLGTLPVKVASTDGSVAVAAEKAPEPAARPRSGGWMIQVGAFPEEKEAKERLAAAQDKAKALLGHADPFTERVAKGAKSLYRARFAGLEKGQAETVCKHLKRSEIPCMLLKN